MYSNIPLRSQMRDWDVTNWNWIGNISKLFSEQRIFIRDFDSLFFCNEAYNWTSYFDHNNDDIVYIKITDFYFCVLILKLSQKLSLENNFKSSFDYNENIK